MNLNVGEKFSLIALNRINIGPELPESFDLPDGYFVTRKLPGEPDSHWREWLGSIRIKLLEKANLYIGCRRPSSNPEVLDGESQELDRRTTDLYWSLFLSGHARVHDRPIQFTGSMLSSGLNVRSVSELNPPFFVPGTPLSPRIDLARLHNAADIASNIEAVYGMPLYGRFKRVMYAFTTGLTTALIDFRLHQFVRCVEGFILPDVGGTKRQFKSRTELFIGPSHHTLMDEIYEIRSQVEHLHDIFDYLPGANRADKYRLLCRRAFEVEDLARYCMATFLKSTVLKPHFETDAATRQFWSLTATERRQLWGHPLDMNSVSASFESQYVDERDLDR